jgi:hypothetical protein
LRQVVQRRFGHPTFGALAAFAGTDQPGAREFLEMVRNRGRADAKTLAEFADAQAGALFGTATPAFAALGQAKKKGQTVRMSEGLEDGRPLFKLHIFDSYRNIYLCPERKIKAKLSPKTVSKIRISGIGFGCNFNADPI